jgi:hypothetical protein
MTRITRVEVITDTGRDYVNWEDDNNITVSYQDDGRTLKVFVNTMKPKSPAEEAYKRVYGAYPMGEPFWIVFEKGYDASQEDYKVEEPEQLKTLYQMFENEGAYGQIYFDDALKVVKSWMSQYADNVLRGECKKGYEECLSINLTLKELETLDKYLELNDKTRPLFDKIRNAYPKPTTLFDVRGRGKCLI